MSQQMNEPHPDNSGRQSHDQVEHQGYEGYPGQDGTVYNNPFAIPGQAGTYWENDKLTVPPRKGMSRRAVVKLIVGGLAAAGFGAYADELLRPQKPTTGSSPKAAPTPVTTQNTTHNRAPDNIELAQQRADVVRKFVNDYTSIAIGLQAADLKNGAISRIMLDVSYNGPTNTVSLTRTRWEQINQSSTRKRSFVAMFDVDSSTGVYRDGTTTFLEASTSVETPKGNYLESQIQLKRQATVANAPEAWELSASGEQMEYSSPIFTSETNLTPSELQETLDRTVGPRYVDPTLS